jgi:hypothetical protein
MSEKILWYYIGKGAFIDGIPAADLTEQDWARLDVDGQMAVENRGLYRRAARPKVEATPAAEPEKEKGKDGGAVRADDVKGKKE